MPTSVPEKRYKSSLAYDANINSAILFGGVGNGVLSDTWIWNGGNWFKQYPSLSPNARYSHKMTYDATRNEVILIGGYDGSTFFNDTWSWKGATQLTDNPPSVTITSPFADAKVSGQVIIQAKASDDKGIAKVEFYDDADKLGEETTTPFSLNWDTNALANGSSHNLKAKAYDTVGQTAEAQVTVTINKIRDAVPTVSITAPQNGTSVSGAVTIKATAYDDRGITKVEFYAKDALLETDSSYPYSCEWNTVGITGSATIKAKAYDTAGQNAIAQMTVNITGDQTPPKITMHPKGQTISSGSKAILSVAAEGAGSLSYQWYSGTTGKTANPIGNATSDSYTTPSLTTEASYWVRVSNAYGRADSNTAVIKVSSSAKLEGAVYSKSTNATISGASITVGTYPAVTTDNNGSYAISNISGGTYKATVSKTGFTTFSDNITIPASGTSRRDFYLSLPVGEIKVTAIKSKYNGILHYLVGTDFLVTYTAHVDWANHPPGKVRFITTKNTYDVATTGDTASKQLNLGLEFSACKTLKAIATSTDNTQSKEFSADFVMMSPIVALALAWQGIDLGDGFRYHTKTGFDFKFIDELIDENIIPENIPLFGKKGFNLKPA